MNDTQSWSHNGGWMDDSRPQMTDSLLPWARGDHVPCWSLLRCHDKPPNVQQNTNTSCYKLEIKEIRRVTTGNNMSRCPLQRCCVVILRSSLGGLQTCKPTFAKFQSAHRRHVESNY